MDNLPNYHWENPVCLVQFNKAHDIIFWMNSKGGFLLSIYSYHQDSSSQRCSNPEEKQVHQSLRTFASAPPSPPVPLRRRATT